MDIPSSIAIIALAALIHASFQLSISVLTLLSGHAIGFKRSHARLLGLSGGFVFGAGIMGLLLLSFFSFVFSSLFSGDVPGLAWAMACGLSAGVAIAVWLFYFRSGQGTTLWIPRPVADYLHERTKATKHTSEAFSLGLTSVIGEILFIVAPLTIAAFALIGLPAIWQLAGLGIYAVISLLPLIVVWVVVGGGISIGNIQKWRESNKRFLQFSAGLGLLILASFVYITQAVDTVALGAGYGLGN